MVLRDRLTNQTERIGRYLGSALRLGAVGLRGGRTVLRSSRRSRNVGALFSPTTASTGLRDAPRVLLRERPALPECGQLLREERVRVGDGLLERSRESLLERVTVVGTEDPAEECVDGTFLVSGAVALDCGLHELAAEGGRRAWPHSSCGTRSQPLSESSAPPGTGLPLPKRAGMFPEIEA